MTLQRDNVFGNDAGIHQIATMSGNTSSGYTSALTVGVLTTGTCGWVVA